MSENLKELVLKNGKIVVEDKAKDLRIRKIIAYHNKQ